jgi:repressor LexA
MTGAGIMPGDLAIVRKQPVAEPGDVVVALVDDEATVKIFRRQRGRPVLEPANPAFAPIRPPAGELTLLGKVIEVRRYLDGVPLLESGS